MNFKDSEGWNMKKLRKSNDQKMLAGVCGGFAEYFGIEVTWIRLIWAVATCFVGTGLLLYIIAAIVMPKAPSAEWE